MLATSLTAILVASSVAPYAKHPEWQKDYAAAYAKAIESKRPLAVFIAKGDAGLKEVAPSGPLSPNVNRLLGEQYVCVYIDAESEEGKKVAQSFDLQQGVIISNREGDKQVLRHNGAVETKDLNRYLTDVVEPTAVLTTTVQGTTERPAIIPRRPIRNAVGAVLDAFAPTPFDPNCRT